MMAKTHMVIGASFGVALLPQVAQGQYTPEQWGAIMCGLVVGSLMPDIDHPQSVIRQFIPIVGGFISKVTRHRGLFHSIVGMIGIYISLGMVSSTVVSVTGISQVLTTYISTGIIIGYGLHIGADMLTKGKVQLFYPLGWRMGLGLMATGGLIELALRTALIGISAIQIIVLFID